LTTATCTASGSTAPADRERVLFATMLRMRRFEEKAGMLFALGTLATPCPLGFGQEAAIAAIVEAHEPSDILLSVQFRPGLELALGAAPSLVLQRLVSDTDTAENPTALMRGPGEEWRRLSHDDASFPPGGGRAGLRIVMASEPSSLAPFLVAPDEKTLGVLIVPADRRPDEWPLPAHIQLRECEGTNIDDICGALAAARESLAMSDASLVLAVLTPPYAGHARDLDHHQPPRRPTTRRDVHDPIALYRRQLITTGRLDEAEATAIENAVRDEIAAAGRAISLSCAP